MGASLLAVVAAINNVSGAGVSNTLLSAHNYMNAVGYGGEPSLLAVRQRAIAWIAAVTSGSGGK